MEKSSKNIFLFFILFLFLINQSFAYDKLNFLSLKKNEVNLRQGPSFKYPIILTYKKNIYL